MTKAKSQNTGKGVPMKFLKWSLVLSLFTCVASESFAEGRRTVDSSVELLREYREGRTWRVLRRSIPPAIGGLVMAAVSPCLTGGSGEAEDGLQKGLCLFYIGGPAAYLTALSLPTFVGQGFSPYSSEDFKLVLNDSSLSEEEKETRAAKMIEDLADHQKVVRYFSGAFASALGVGLGASLQFAFDAPPTLSASVGTVGIAYGLIEFLFESEEEGFLERQEKLSKKVSYHFAPSFNVDSDKQLNYGASLEIRF